MASIGGKTSYEPYDKKKKRTEEYPATPLESVSPPSELTDDSLIKKKNPCRHLGSEAC